MIFLQGDISAMLNDIIFVQKEKKHIANKKKEGLPLIQVLGVWCINHVYDLLGSQKN